MDGLGGVLGLEKEELSDNDVGRVVIDGAIDADYALLEKPREYVVGSLPSRGVLYYHRNQSIPPPRTVTRLNLAAKRWSSQRGGGREPIPELARNEAAHGGEENERAKRKIRRLGLLSLEI